MTDLTPERRAELRTDAENSRLFRFVTGTASDGYPSSGYESIDDDITALLDAADERDRLLRTVSEMTDNLIDAGYSEAELGAERAALAATVERVRSELSRLADESQRDGWDSPTMRGVIASIRNALDGADDE